jgi:hypothetical protein
MDFAKLPMTLAVMMNNGSPCCEAATENILLPPLWACTIWTLSGLGWLALLICPAEPWDEDPEIEFPECSNPLSSCPPGAFSWVNHPVEDAPIAYVYCGGYSIMTHCHDACDDACNEAFCDLHDDHCDIRMPDDTPCMSSAKMRQMGNVQSAARRAADRAPKALAAALPRGSAES